MIEYNIKSIKGKKNFEKIFSKARRFYEQDAAAFVTYCKHGTVNRQTGKITFNYAVAVRKKNAKKAVVRNRIKRLMRESIRIIIREYEIREKVTNIDSVVFVWSNCPIHPKLINLLQVKPVILKLMERADSYSGAII